MRTQKAQVRSPFLAAHAERVQTCRADPTDGDPPRRPKAVSAKLDALPELHRQPADHETRLPASNTCTGGEPPSPVAVESGTWCGSAVGPAGRGVLGPPHRPVSCLPERLPADLRLSHPAQTELHHPLMPTARAAPDRYPTVPSPPGPNRPGPTGPFGSRGPFPRALSPLVGTLRVRHDHTIGALRLQTVRGARNTAPACGFASGDPTLLRSDGQHARFRNGENTSRRTQTPQTPARPLPHDLRPGDGVAGSRGRGTRRGAGARRGTW